MELVAANPIIEKDFIGAIFFLVTFSIVFGFIAWDLLTKKQETKSDDDKLGEIPLASEEVNAALLEAVVRGTHIKDEYIN